jgi:hypothetical protein
MAVAVSVALPYGGFTIMYKAVVKMHCTFLMSGIEEGLVEMIGVIKSLLAKDNFENKVNS